jgi:hypothetical protein
MTWLVGGMRISACISAQCVPSAQSHGREAARAGIGAIS